MSSFHSISILVLSFLSIQSTTASTNTEKLDDNLQMYIVHVRPPPPEHTGTCRDWHESFLPDPSRLRHSYSHVLSGFSAMLTPSDLDRVRKLDGFMHATPSETYSIQTTHTPSFLHLTTDPSGFWAQSAKYGEAVIIGILDNGIAPTHPSFDGTGMPMPPSKWNGMCDFNGTFACNNKLIGGRTFRNGTELSSPPLDDNGHGTHTASTAAGRFVANASILGNAWGTAAGMAPYAHLAAYKVCWGDECTSADKTAAIDMAVADGVDVISISTDGPAKPLYEDPTAVAAFSAVKRGVFVAMSAGNEGPSPSTVDNISPWVLTVGASTTDRRIRAVVKLRNGTELVGESAYQPSNFSGFFSLVFPQSTQYVDAVNCSNATALRQIGVQGKIVLCKGQYTEADKIVKDAGGAAMIRWGEENRGFDTFAWPNVIPASYLTYVDGLAIFDYINSTANPTATIEFDGTAIGGSLDPAVAAFSSRGPSRINSGIMKPDIIGPGVNILAAWPSAVGPFPIDPPFNMISGTSMSCPHLSGIAALLKSAHPDWSPAMIKSAIMTTADATNSGGQPIIDLYNRRKASFYAMGAGHVNPVKANHPGLVYDIQSDDYIPYFCGLNYTDDQVRTITNNHTISCANYNGIDEADLNYPSIMAVLPSNSGGSSTVRVRRTLTNVGSANSTYTAYIKGPPGFTMDVVPDTLQFPTTGEKRSFSVTFGLNSTDNVRLSSPSGYLIWTSSDGAIQVRSPILVTVR